MSKIAVKTGTCWIRITDEITGDTVRLVDNGDNAEISFLGGMSNVVFGQQMDAPMAERVATWLNQWLKDHSDGDEVSAEELGYDD